MKGLVKVCVSLCLVLFLAASFANSAVEVAKKAPVDLLFAVVARDGSLVHTDGKQYQLTIPVKSIESVLAFSDRPNRLTFRLGLADYQKIVYSGSDSFRESPPNIALVWSNEEEPDSTYTLEEHRRVGENMVYTLNRLGSAAPSMHGRSGPVALFIDALEINELSICMRVGRSEESSQSLAGLKGNLQEETREQAESVPRICSYGR
jgi:hypothetical protein